MKKAKLTLSKIDTTNLMIKIVHLELNLDKLGENLKVKLSTSGHTLRINSDHLTHDMRFILNWLDEDSTIKTESLRDNFSEVVLFGKEMLKAHKQLAEIKTI